VNCLGIRRTSRHTNGRYDAGKEDDGVSQSNFYRLCIIENGGLKWKKLIYTIETNALGENGDQGQGDVAILSK